MGHGWKVFAESRANLPSRVISLGFWWFVQFFENVNPLQSFYVVFGLHRVAFRS